MYNKDKGWDEKERFTGQITNQVPRHAEVNELLAKSILKEAKNNPGEEKR